MRIAAMRQHVGGQWFVKVGGKCRYLGTDRTVAESKYREIIVSHYGPSKALPVLGDSVLTVDSLLDQYLVSLQETIADKWKEKKQGIYRQVCKQARELYGTLPAEDFGPKAYQAVRKAMACPGRNCNYVNMLCTRLKAAWKWGVSQELVSESSYRRLLTVPDLQPGALGLADAREVMPVPRELFEATLPYLSETCADLLRLLWISGARPGEIIALTPAELQQDGGFLVYRPKSHKTKRYNKLRAVVFGPECEAILRRYWPASPTERFFRCYADSAVVRNAIYRACERGKLQRWHTYQLRHAAVTRIALEHGKEVAMAVAGHASVITTDRYDHGAVERAKRAAG